MAGRHGGLITALNRAYGIVERRPLWKRRLIAGVMTIGLALFVVPRLALVLAGGA